MAKSKFKGGCYFPSLYTAMLSLPDKKTAEQAHLISGQLKEEAQRLDSEFKWVPKALGVLGELYQKESMSPLSFLPKQYYHGLLGCRAKDLVGGFDGFQELSLASTAKYGLQLQIMELQHYLVLGCAKAEYEALTTIHDQPKKLIKEMAKGYFQGAKTPERFDNSLLESLVLELDTIDRA